jgi:hypothetical protein
MITIEAAQSHISQLLETHGIHLATENEIKEHCIHAWRNNSPAWAETDSPAHVYLPPICSEGAYAVALHEIGHIKGRQWPEKKNYSHQLDNEHWAWEWAARNSLMWTPTMEKMRRACLATYIYANHLRKASVSLVRKLVGECQRRCSEIDPGFDERTGKLALQVADEFGGEGVGWTPELLPLVERLLPGELTTATRCNRLHFAYGRARRIVDADDASYPHDDVGVIMPGG